MLSLAEGGPAAVVIGLDCITGLQTARILARRGVPVVGIATNPGHFCCRSRHVLRVIRADVASEELIAALEALAGELAERAVLYPCTDESVRLLGREAGRLRHAYRVVLPPAAVLDQLQEKHRFHQLATSLGIRVPRTIELSSRRRAKQAARELGFPCVVKPVARDGDWEREAGSKVLRAHTPGELLEIFARHGRRFPLLAQEWVEGDDSALYSFNGYFDAKSQPVATFIARKLRQWPPETGVSCLGEECRNDEVLDTAVRLFQSVRFQGLAYLEMKRDARNGMHYAIEANVGRPTGRSAIAEAAGVEILHTMYLDAIGAHQPSPAALAQRYTGMKWIFWRNDLRAAFHYWRAGQLTLGEWLSSVRGRKVDAVLAWDDLSPFMADLVGAARSAVRRLHRGSDEATTAEGSGADDQPGEGTEEAGPAGETESAAPAVDTTPAIVDFDVHGIVALRLIDPGPADVAVVADALGLEPVTLPRKPDLLLRFRERVDTGDLTYVEVQRTGFDGGGFYVLDPSTGEATLRLPMGDAGSPAELVCRRDGRRIHLLRPLIRLAALWKDHLPFHASAFEWNGGGVIVTGWTHGGKTSAMLAFAEHGARFVGDDLLFLEPGGERMYGLPSAMGISLAQVRQSPRLAAARRVRQRAIAGGVGALKLAAERAAGPDGSGGSLARLASKLEDRSRIRLGPEAVFPAGLQLVTRPEKLFLMMSHPGSDIRVDPIDPGAVAARMVHSMDAEDRALLDQYHAFRYAFPDARNERIEQASELRARLIGPALARLDCYVVRHPFPAPLDELFAAMRPFCETAPRTVEPVPEPIVAQ